MTYADFSFYRDVYLGSQVGEEDFPRLALRASQYIDSFTMGKARSHAQMEAVKMACCALAEQLEALEQLERLGSARVRASLETSGQSLRSETVGPWSRTYETGGEGAASAAALAAEAKARLAETARQYLALTGLLYRGGRRCSCSPTR